MKRTLLLIPFLLLSISKGYSTPTVNPESQIKKLTVVSQIIEKNHISVEETTLIDGVNVADGTKASTKTVLTNYDFSYNNIGQLTAINSYLVEDGQPADSLLTNMQIDDDNQLNKVIFGENKMTLDLVYEKNVLQSTEFKDSFYNDTRVSKITYNRLDLPGAIEITSQLQNSDSKTINFIYDPNNNVKIVSLDANKLTHTYDKKKYALAYLPYAFNISHYLSPPELIFTNYVQQNNVVKIESKDLITTIDYTYNTQDLPVTAKIKTVIKSYPSDDGYTYEYEFIYKTLEITE